MVDVNDNGGNDAGLAPSPRALQGARESPNGVLNAEACPYLDGRPADARGSRAQAKAKLTALSLVGGQSVYSSWSLESTVQI